MRGNVADDVHLAGLRVHLHLYSMTTPSICSREVPLEVLAKKFCVWFVEVGGHEHSVPGGGKWALRATLAMGVFLSESFLHTTVSSRSERSSRGTLTVSYTHLRAHETKANLVCRL